MAISTSVSLSMRTETEYLSFLIDYAVQHNFSVALWRLPNDPVTHLTISKSPERLTYTSTLEDLPPGFIFAPFEPAAQRIFLKADLSFSFSNGELDQPQTAWEALSNVSLNDVPANKDFLINKPQIYCKQIDPTPSTSKDHFIRVVSDGIREIEKGTFEKVVISRRQEVKLSEAFDISEAFQNLCRLYSNALISFVSIPDTGSWLGATPELLVSVEDKHTFRTTALAGTQPYVEGTNLKSVAWTQKDIEEQALVERYIISCFKKIRLREYEEHGPRTVIAGNLIHLKSDFTVDMQATNFPQLGSVMLQLLHPTSAVCGVPLDTSLKFLRQEEGHQREFYAGYLGPLNFNNRIDIFVNLRCLQLLPGKALLYAGAGITQDSNPEKEWEETELKLNTLLKVIK
ncbi:chorismate-binding protein [Chryseolinea sp. H1M3-3]|uniref:chorismate-binding protein n=1 Tax=Chryseolinea sp. H1M3-3 TaxID=3034144 RepID=UPI0023EC9C4A|nr:chorismate-binding protein [Chryseolinea sp. H1M3-3]